MAKKEFTKFLLHIQGGIGKCIMATAVIRSYKTANPGQEIVVISGYPEVFVNNPDVSRNLNFNTPYLWKDYYSQPDVKIYAGDPYFTSSWIKNEKKHLIDIWCEEIGVPSVQKTPLLYFSGPEVDELNGMIKTDKPLVVVQSTSGVNAAARSWTRNPPYDEFDEFIRPYFDTHYIVHVCLPETPALKHVHQRVDSFSRRQAMALIYFCQTFIGIDSFGLHTRAANPNPPGYSFIFFPLAESIKRLGYVQKLMTNVEPTLEVQNLIKNSHDYYASVFQHSIDSIGENCPVPPGKKWFNLVPDRL